MINGEWTDRDRRILAEAMEKEMKPVPHMFPTRMSEAEYAAFKQAEMEHAPDVAVRIVNFHVQYYNTKTGEIISTHI